MRFSRQVEADFQKISKNFIDLFLGRPNWFSELSQRAKWPYFDQVFFQIFEETDHKRLF